MEKPNLNKIISENKNKLKHAPSKGLKKLPTHGWLDRMGKTKNLLKTYENGGWMDDFTIDSKESNQIPTAKKGGTIKENKDIAAAILKFGSIEGHKLTKAQKKHFKGVVEGRIKMYDHIADAHKKGYYQKGGPIITNNPNDPRLRAYQDSLSLSNYKLPSGDVPRWANEIPIYKKPVQPYIYQKEPEIKRLKNLGVKRENQIVPEQMMNLGRDTPDINPYMASLPPMPYRVEYQDPQGSMTHQDFENEQIGSEFQRQQSGQRQGYYKFQNGGLAEWFKNHPSTFDASAQPQLKQNNTKVVSTGKKVDPYINIIKKDPNSQANIKKRTMKDFATKVVVGTALPYIARTAGASAPYLGAALTADVAGIGGLNAVNAASAYFGTKAIYNVPNVVNKIKTASSTGNASDIADALVETGVTTLDALPLAGKIIKEGPTTINEFRNYVTKKVNNSELFNDVIEKFQGPEAVIKQINRLTPKNVSKYVNLKNDITGGKGQFNLGVYPFKKNPNYLLKVDNVHKVREFLEPDVKVLSELPALMKNINNPRIAKNIKDINLTGSGLKLPGYKGKSDASYYMTNSDKDIAGRVMTRVKGVHPEKLNYEDFAEIPTSTYQQALDDVRYLHDQGLAVELNGDNILYDKANKSINLIDISKRQEIDDYNRFLSDLYNVKNNNINPESFKENLWNNMMRNYRNAAAGNSYGYTPYGSEPVFDAETYNKVFQKLRSNVYNIKKTGGWVDDFSYAQQGGVIKDDMGQWNHPGEITQIQGNNMATHGYGNIPLYVVPDKGQPRMVYPNTGNHIFPGASKFTEYPMKTGGWLDGYH